MVDGAQLLSNFRRVIFEPISEIKEMILLQARYM